MEQLSPLLDVADLHASLSNHGVCKFHDGVVSGGVLSVPVRTMTDTALSGECKLMLSG